MANRVQERLKFVEGVYGDNWRKLRESEGKSVREFQKTIPMSFSSISKIENEITPPTIAQINLYQEHFHCSLDYLTGHTTVKDVELSKMSEYTGLTEKALEKLHDFYLTHQDIIYPDGRHLGGSYLYLSALIENEFIQEIAKSVTDLSLNSGSLINNNGDSDDKHRFDRHSFQSLNNICDVDKVRLMEALINIINEYDERVVHKKEYLAMKLKYESELKEIFDTIKDKYNGYTKEGD